MTSERRVHWSQKVETVAPHASKTERRAEDAERAMQAAALIRFLSPRLGEEMGGSIISIFPFGFFVRLDELPIEGLVPVATLGAYYEFDPSTQTLEPAGRGRGKGKGKGKGKGRGGGKRSAAASFRPGQRVRVKLTDLNSAARQISFELAE
jgi:ribonuclease R